MCCSHKRSVWMGKIYVKKNSAFQWTTNMTDHYKDISWWKCLHGMWNWKFLSIKVPKQFCLCTNYHWILLYWTSTLTNIYFYKSFDFQCFYRPIRILITLLVANTSDQFNKMLRQSSVLYILQNQEQRTISTIGCKLKKIFK